ENTGAIPPDGPKRVEYKDAFVITLAKPQVGAPCHKQCGMRRPELVAFWKEKEEKSKLGGAVTTCSEEEDVATRFDNLFNVPGFHKFSVRHLFAAPLFSSRWKGLFSSHETLVPPGFVVGGDGGFLQRTPNRAQIGLQ
ncbi:MAG: hypothetical protein AAF570_19630, partial [Bacteroidota bacterium]